jgi:hypothetical protein
MCEKMPDIVKTFENGWFSWHLFARNFDSHTSDCAWNTQEAALHNATSYINGLNTSGVITLRRILLPSCNKWFVPRHYIWQYNVRDVVVCMSNRSWLNKEECNEDAKLYTLVYNLKAVLKITHIPANILESSKPPHVIIKTHVHSIIENKNVVYVEGV